ncbi:MAG TPA: MFS transporter [Labilithrix sp.]|nr:MFS transporter [Labilithrix sp.]
MVGESAPAVMRSAPPRRVLPLLLVGYAAFYLCRANVEPALNLLAIEHGYDNEQLGAVLGIALGAYAAGKLVLSPIADLWGGKGLLVASLLGTAFVSLAIAVGDPPRRFGGEVGLLVIGVLVAANRFVQAGGWGGLVHIVDVNFDETRRGTVMGIVSTSYDIGNVVALGLSAALVQAGAGWRGLFVVNPLVVLAVAIAIRIALPATPAHRASRPAAPAANGSDAAPSASTGPADKNASLRSIALRLARQPPFWFASALSFLLTFVRAAFMTWTPRFLYEVSAAAQVRSAMSSSIAKSAFFGVAGMMGSVLTGRISDRLGPGRRAPVMTTSLALLVACTLALAHTGVDSPMIATAGVAACGLFLLGPYSLLAGAVSLDLGGGRGAATAAGFIDAVGYLGASLAAVVLGSVSKRAGWTAAFDVVAAVSCVALLLALFWSAARRPSPSPDPST